MEMIYLFMFITIINTLTNALCMCAIGFLCNTSVETMDFIKHITDRLENLEQKAS